MAKLKALDLFCKAGGATRGLQLAGFDVTGVDIQPQPHYCGDRFIQADALTVSLEGFEFIWASPPCQRFSLLAYKNGNALAHPDLIAPIRKRLVPLGCPYIIENVVGARRHLIHPIMLCGTMFSLGTSQADLWRHRLFESNFPIANARRCYHRKPVIGVYGGGDRRRFGVISVTGHT
jgi:DNA (cytosine-5)-methyltransferase 1